jgi:hypothetical protein
MTDWDIDLKIFIFRIVASRVKVDRHWRLAWLVGRK